MKPFWKKLLKTVGIVCGVIVGVLALALAVASIAEYRPKETETLELVGNGSKTLAIGDEFTVVSWNIGYGGLSETADFFMDGGEGVRTQDKESVTANTQAVIDELQGIDPDVVFLQEADVNSTRSWHINQVQMIREALAGFQSSFANNFKVLWLPYPIPMMGHVDSGILTLSKYTASEATRLQLPCPFSWPIRTMNLKRCLDVTRIPIEGSDKELVLVNLHLEAYDDGEGKIAQTAMLAELLQKEYDAGNYVIAGGDFNQSFNSIDTSMYPLQGGDLWECGELDTTQFSPVWQFLMDTEAPTCRSLDRPLDLNDATFQYYMIDGFIVSDNLTVEFLETQDLGFANSDHNPVVMTVMIGE